MIPSLRFDTHFAIRRYMIFSMDTWAWRANRTRHENARFYLHKHIPGCKRSLSTVVLSANRYFLRLTCISTSPCHGLQTLFQAAVCKHALRDTNESNPGNLGAVLADCCTVARQHWLC